MEVKSLDFNKPLQIVSGEEVVIFSKIGEGFYPILGAIKIEAGLLPLKWAFDARCSSGEPLQTLINIPPKMIKLRLYVTAYADGSSLSFTEFNKSLDDSFKLAKNFPVDVEIPEGYGL